MKLIKSQSFRDGHRIYWQLVVSIIWMEAACHHSSVAAWQQHQQYQLHLI